MRQLSHSVYDRHGCESYEQQCDVRADFDINQSPKNDKVYDNCQLKDPRPEFHFGTISPSQNPIVNDDVCPSVSDHGKTFEKERALRVWAWAIGLAMGLTGTQALTSP